jgi:2-dehydropantoate 2-reductase
MRFLVMGTGGVGGYFGGKLAKAGHPVAFVARGDHLRALQERGLSVRSDYGDFHVDVTASNDPSTLGPADVVLFCVKGYDTESAARQLQPVVGSDTMVISLQNGIDNETIIESILPKHSVIGGSCRIISTIEEPGVIVQTGRNHRFDFGEMGGGTSARCQQLLEVLTQAEIDAHLSENIQLTLWEKFLGLDPVSCISAAARCTIGEVFANPHTRSLQRQAMLEVIHIAAAQGIDLGGEAAADRQIDFSTRAVQFDGTTSLYRDAVAGKRLEIDTLAGAAIRLGKQYGVPTPVHEFLYAVLYPAHRRALQAMGLEA